MTPVDGPPSSNRGLRRRGWCAVRLAAAGTQLGRVHVNARRAHPDPVAKSACHSADVACLSRTSLPPAQLQIREFPGLRAGLFQWLRGKPVGFGAWIHGFSIVGDLRSRNQAALGMPSGVGVVLSGFPDRGAKSPRAWYVLCQWRDAGAHAVASVRRIRLIQPNLQRSRAPSL